LQLLLTNKYISALAANAIEEGGCRGRIVVASSRNKKLIELNPKSGKLWRLHILAVNLMRASPVCMRARNLLDGSALEYIIQGYEYTFRRGRESIFNVERGGE
jgi:hypothetical protein